MRSEAIRRRNALAALALLLALFLSLAGCARIAAVDARRAAIGGGLSVEGLPGWNRLPAGTLGADTVWTRDGPALDRLLFVGGRRDGEPLFARSRPRLSLLFRAGMTPTEVMELWSTELALADQRLVTVGGLLPTVFAGTPGFRFQYAYADRDGLLFDGYAAGAVAEGRLYLIAFTGTRAHQFRAYWPEVAALINSARIDPL